METGNRSTSTLIEREHTAKTLLQNNNAISKNILFTTIKSTVSPNQVQNWICARRWSIKMPVINVSYVSYL